MKVFLISGAVLVTLGILALVYGQFSYTKETQGAKLGPIELTVQEKETVDLPVWLGAASIAAGAAVLAYGGMKR